MEPPSEKTGLMAENENESESGSKIETSQPQAPRPTISLGKRLLLCGLLAFGWVTMFMSLASELDDSTPAIHHRKPCHGVSHRPLTFMPEIGLGTWQSEKDRVADAVVVAFETGYRHIDAASAYGNEKYVGEGIARAGLPRSSFWVTSKLWNNAHAPHDVRPAVEKTLSDLGLDYLDLYLMHWPVAFDPESSKSKVVDIDILATWHAMEHLVTAGLVKNIGISNFNKAQVKHILKGAHIRPAAHEFETHPYLQQQGFVDWNKKMGIQVIAYSPFGNANPIYGEDTPKVLDDPVLALLAKKHGVSTAQAVLAWGMERGTIVIPKSVNETHVAENFKAFGLKLGDLEMKTVSLQDKKIRFNNPSKSWGVDLFEGLDG